MRRNKIVRLKDNEDRWQDNEETIRKIAIDYFIQPFKSENDKNFVNALEATYPKVSQHMNNILMSPFYVEEVKKQ